MTKNPEDYRCSTSNKAPDTENTKTLRDLLDTISRTTNSGQRHLVILDIDSTLLDTSYRTGSIFKEFALLEYHQSIFPELCQAISEWEDTVEVYDPIEFVNHHSNYKVDKDSDLATYLMKFWRKRFFNEEWLSKDLPYFGATSFVDQCYNLGSDVAYLTGRESKSLLEATKRSLSVHRFKFDEHDSRTRLMLKAHKSIKDKKYKDEGLNELKQGYDRVVYIENEVELVLMAKEKHPDVHTYLFDSVHSGRESIGQKRVASISSWNFG